MTYLYFKKIQLGIWKKKSTVSIKKSKSLEKYVRCSKLATKLPDRLVSDYLLFIKQTKKQKQQQQHKTHPNLQSFRHLVTCENKAEKGG